MFYEPLDRLEVSISAIRAFNHLVTAAINQGDDFSYVAAGLQHLLETQVDILATKTEEIRGEFIRLEKEKSEFSAMLALNRKHNEINSYEFSADSALNSMTTKAAAPGADYYRQNQTTIARLSVEGRTMDEIAILTGLARDRVRVFLETMPDDVKEAAAKPRPHEMRNAFIADRIRDGYNPSEIAQALNLKRSTVEKVIGKLLGANLADVGEIEERKAVNE